MAKSESAFQEAASAAPASVTLQVHVAQGFLARARGLVGRPPPAPGCGLLLPGVRSVHGFGMRHRIDLLFLDGQGVIVRVASLAPAAIAGCRKARHVLEMRSGEILRLRLRPPMRPLLLLLDDIFGQETGKTGGPNRSGAATDPVPGRRPVRLIVSFLIAGILAHNNAYAAPPDGRGAGGATASLAGWDAVPRDSTRAGAAGMVSSAHGQGGAPAARAIPVELLRLLEEQAETIYREVSDETADRDLVEVYEALAEMAADRSPHAWLRIGNIRQRAGLVGEAIDAYRRVHAPVDESTLLAGSRVGRGSGPGSGSGAEAGAGAKASAAAAPAPDTGASRPAEAGAALAAERKALLNLTALSLEQARRSLERLASLPTAGNRDSPRGEPAPPAAGPGGDRDAVAGLRRQLEWATQAQAEQSRRVAEPSTPRGSTALPYGTQVVERYTASARRNAVTSARGSLHIDPSDELPAKPVPKPRPMPVAGSLPRVEYLLGDPLRSRQHPAGEGDSPGAAVGGAARTTAAAGTTRKRSADEAGGGADSRSAEAGRFRTRD